MENSSCLAFFDELEKIAQYRDMGEKPAPEQKFITKDKLKRHLLAAGAVLAGGTAGHFGGRAARAAILKRKGNIADLVRKYPTAAKAVPIAVGGAGMGAAALAALRTRKHLQYVEHGDGKSNKHST